MEKDFRTLLLTVPEIAALGISRVNWGLHPQGVTLPAVVINKISGSEWTHMNGPNGVYEARIQVNVDAMTYAEARELSVKIHDTLHSYRGGAFLYIEGTNDTVEQSGGSNEAQYPFRGREDFMATWKGSE